MASDYFVSLDFEGTSIKCLSSEDSTESAIIALISSASELLVIVEHFL